MMKAVGADPSLQHKSKQQLLDLSINLKRQVHAILVSLLFLARPSTSTRSSLKAAVKKARVNSPR
ncbi:hypothetical protein BC828DRAFT_214481 [Blastocladiella britannica]|nr:hypothetical protein BC828DRAFT_214481 [Blastocladiella britannica]